LSKVYTITSGKGGVGKTTIAANLGVSLGTFKKTIVVDADLAMDGIATVFGLGETPVTLHELLAGEASIERAVYSTHGVDVLPSGPTITGFLKADTNKLEGVIKKLTKTYDYVIIDSPPGLNKYSLTPLKIADEVLLVVTPDLLAVQAAAKMRSVVKTINANMRGAIVNRFRKPSFFAKEFMRDEDIKRRLKADILGIIPEDPAVIESINLKKPVVVYKPKSPASKAINSLAEGLTKSDKNMDSHN
jgi:septum site-determining protein MinD